jgi:hypothetical protein
MMMLATAVAMFGLTVLAAVPVSAAGQAKGVSYIWDNVALTDTDGTTGTYQVRGGVTATKDGQVTTSTTWCQYFVQPASGVSWQQWVNAGSYSVNYAVTNQTEAGIKQFCTENFPNRVRV